MRNELSKAPHRALVFLALAVAGGCAEAPPLEPSAVEAGAALFGPPVEDPQRFEGHLDAYFERIAEAVPGFGGFFYDEAGIRNVYLTPGADAAALRTRLGDFRLREAQYDFIELNAMRHQARPVLGIAGVVFLDADEAANRVRIGVEDERIARQVEHALAMLGVAREAVIIEVAEPILPLQSLPAAREEAGHHPTLRDRVRPVAGGLQIQFTFGTCTLGFNVRAVHRPSIQGFMVASHCTNTQGELSNTQFHQPQTTTPDGYIGVEVHDVPFFTGGVCPIGRVCRWSDVAGARYAPGVESLFGRIYRTTHWTGNLVIHIHEPLFTIVAERPFPFLGEVVHKVGRTTGWTSGAVTGTCVDTNLGLAPITLLCQEHVRSQPGISGGGDSGSPVFDLVPGSELDVRLTGLLWGGNQSGTIMIFSAMAEIRFENPGIAGFEWTTH